MRRLEGVQACEGDRDAERKNSVRYPSMIIPASSRFSLPLAGCEEISHGVFGLIVMNVAKS